MKLLIAIPSLNRPDRIGQATLPIVQGLKGIDWKVFVEPHELFLYKHFCGRDNVVSIGETHKGLGYSLGFIAEYAKENGYDLILKLDDDIKSFDMIDTKDPVKVLQYIINDIVPDFDANPTLGGVRFVQTRFWLFSKKKGLKKYTHKNQPLWGVNFIRVAAHHKLPEEVKQFTDTILSLFLWKKGFYTLTYGMCGINVVANAGRGGCVSQDRKANSISTIEFMQKEWRVGFKEVAQNPWGIDIDISNYLQTEIIH